jgi:hypothetical protein
METNTDTGSGLFGFISKAAKSVSDAANTVTQAIKGDQQTNDTNALVQSPSNTTGYTGTGGARSRRRKCNKKHRHTKSCRKYVKKGRKTRKH